VVQVKTVDLQGGVAGRSGRGTAVSDPTKKVYLFCFSVLLEGTEKIRSLSMVFCDEIEHPQPFTFCDKLKLFFLFGTCEDMYSALSDLSILTL
jgi:hypothetical protein